MGMMVVPIAEGKVDVWKEWIGELMANRKAEFEDFNKRHGLSRHSAWLAETPTGPVVAALHEGQGAERFMESLQKSSHEFDLWFKSKLEEIHGFDFSAPPTMPATQIHLDSQRA